MTLKIEPCPTEIRAVTAAPSRPAEVVAGDADATPRIVRRRAAAWQNGVRLPFAGSVSMDGIGLDVAGRPEGALHPGDAVERRSPGCDADEVARAARTVNDEMPTSLGACHRRGCLDRVTV